MWADPWVAGHDGDDQMSYCERTLQDIGTTMLSVPNEQDGSRPCLDRWMRRLLRFAGTFNLFAGLGMILLYHEGYRLFGIEKPQLVMPLQLTGVLVMLFGIGYHRVASRPIANYDLLLLGFLSKAGGSILGIGYVFWGPLPLFFLFFLFFADIIYLPFFWLILRRIAAIRGPLTDAD